MNAKEILNKIKWSEDIGKAEVWYLHRGAPNDTMIISGKDIIALHHSFMELEAKTMIPYHRILKIFYYRASIPFPTLKNLFHKFSRDGELVWERR